MGIPHLLACPSAVSAPSLILPNLAPPANDPTLVAVSGGRDSVALLHLLISAGHRNLVVCHLNHGLRGRESGQDAAFVRRLAARYGLPCVVAKVDIRKLAEEKRQTLEEAGRGARMAFFEQTALQYAASCIYLAHHAEDQAETILANLCRGTGLRGLGGMKPKSLMGGLIWLRPLLEIRKQEIEAYVHHQKLPFREDSSNASSDYTRNRLRHEVIPLLNHVFRRDVPQLLTRLGKQARRDAACLDRQTVELLAAGLVDEGKRLKYRTLLALDLALSSRILEHCLREVWQVRRVDLEMVEKSQTMLLSASPAKMSLPEARLLRRKGGWMWVEKSIRD